MIEGVRPYAVYHWTTLSSYGLPEDMIVIMDDELKRAMLGLMPSTPVRVSRSYVTTEQRVGTIQFQETLCAGRHCVQYNWQ